MIARTWRGWTSIDDQQTYVDYLLETGIREYEATSANLGAYILTRLAPALRRQGRSFVASLRDFTPDPLA